MKVWQYFLDKEPLTLELIDDQNTYLANEYPYDYILVPIDDFLWKNMRIKNILKDSKNRLECPK